MSEAELKDLAKALRERMRQTPIIPAQSADDDHAHAVHDPLCEICHGLGYFRYDVQFGHPEFGKLQPCHCTNYTNLMGEKSGLTLHERSWNWDKIRNVGDAHLAINAVQKVLKRGYGWVYLWGGYGQAKSVILKIAVAQYLQTGKAAYVRMAEIIDNLRQAYDQENDSAERRLEFWSSMPFLAIDEFDRMRDTEYAGERRFILMDRRYVDAERRETITIMAGNFDPRDPNIIPGYLIDRIFDGRFEVVHLGGKSMRPSMRYDEQEELF